MDMLRHDHVSANGYVEVALGTPRKKDERRMDLVASQARDTVMRAKGYEVERAGFKNSSETKRSSPEILLHPKNL